MSMARMKIMSIIRWDLAAVWLVTKQPMSMTVLYGFSNSETNACFLNKLDSDSRCGLFRFVNRCGCLHDGANKAEFFYSWKMFLEDRWTLSSLTRIVDQMQMHIPRAVQDHWKKAWTWGLYPCVSSSALLHVSVFTSIVCYPSHPGCFLVLPPLSVSLFTPCVFNMWWTKREALVERYCFM